jgi:hypothetical protein
VRLPSRPVASLQRRVASASPPRRPSTPRCRSAITARGRLARYAKLDRNRLLPSAVTAAPPIPSSPASRLDDARARRPVAAAAHAEAALRRTRSTMTGLPAIDTPRGRVRRRRSDGRRERVPHGAGPPAVPDRSAFGCTQRAGKTNDARCTTPASSIAALSATSRGPVAAAQPDGRAAARSSRASMRRCTGRRVQ